MATAQGTTPRRAYRSDLRARQAGATKRAVVRAAHELFLADGWAATGMRDVAGAAGVALETVYSHFSSKRGLLLAVVESATVGDDAPVALAERPEFQAMGRGRRAARLAAAAELLTEVHGRMAAITKVLLEAASGDDELAELLEVMRERRRQDTAAAFELLVGRAPTPLERDGLWAVTSPDVYVLLTGAGWTTDEYQAWMQATLERVLPRS